MSAFIAGLIAKAVRPHRVVPIPLRDADGKALCEVHIRCISQTDEDCAWANAALYVAKLIRDGKELPWKPEDLEHNARAAEILAIACRKVDDPSKPFFEGGVVDTREFLTDELGQLMLVYAELKEESYPSIGAMDGGEFDAWIELIAKGAERFPFWSISRSKLEALSRFASESLVEARATITTLTSSSTSDS